MGIWMRVDDKIGRMKPNHYSFIDALRGYAILLVMAVHSSQASPEWVGLGRQLIDQGARGVQLFFVASALTLAMSWHSRRDGTFSFYLRRLFRIAPMFWLGIAFFLWLDGFGPRYFAPNGIDGADVLLTALFLHGWHPETITSVVHGGWSIAVEMTFYLIFPLLIFLFRSWVAALVALLITNAVANSLFLFFWQRRAGYWPEVSDDLTSTFLTLWFPTQLPVFAVGFMLFFLVRDYRGVLPRWGCNLLLVGSFLSMAFLALYPLPISRFGVSSYSAYGLCFGVFAYCLADGAGRWLVNAPIRYLGKISYSAYLWHFAILGGITHLALGGFDPLGLLVGPHGFAFFLGFFPLVIALTAIFSTLTYQIVELPMIGVGNRLIDNMVKRSLELKVQR